NPPTSALKRRVLLRRCLSFWVWLRSSDGIWQPSTDLVLMRSAVSQPVKTPRGYVLLNMLTRPISVCDRGGQHTNQSRTPQVLRQTNLLNASHSSHEPLTARP